MNEWRIKFNVMINRVLDAVEKSAERVMARGKGVISWMKSRLLHAGQNAKNVMVKAVTAVAYYSLASVIVVALLVSVVITGIAVSILSFFVYLIDAS